MSSKKFESSKELIESVALAKQELKLELSDEGTPVGCEKYGA